MQLTMDATTLNTIVTIIAIVIPIATFFFRKAVLKFLKLLLLRIFSGHVVIDNNYYSHDFVLKNINRSKRIIRIMCVRNERITEPDIIEAMRKFINSFGVVEIFALNPDVADCVIEECMCILPGPPKDTNQFKRQVDINHEKIGNLYYSLGENERKKFNYYHFNTLPLIHMCQFDDIIYMGFQLFHRQEVENSLLKYSILIKTKSQLGGKIIEQFDYIRSNKSSSLFNN